MSSTPMELMPTNHGPSIRHSEKLDKLLPALLKAQKHFSKIAKDGENEAYKRNGKPSKYATLDSVVTALQPALNENGLFIMQHLESNNAERELSITTTLWHEGEQFIESRLIMPTIGQNGRFDPQTVASASTYGRRVTMLAITGQAPTDDDDGNAASGVGSSEAAQSVASKKIAELRKKTGITESPQLTVVQVGEDVYEVAGQPEVMNTNKELLLLYGKRKGKETAVTMTAEKLDEFRFQFVEQRGGQLIPLKATWVREPGAEG
jgi:ERF superfamily